MKIAALIASCALLSACATASFAPPPVRVTVKGGHKFDYSSCFSVTKGVSIEPDRNVNGALTVVDGFIAAYRCAAHDASDGRLIFDLPAYAASATAVAASALGGGADGAIVGSAAANIFTNGKAYFSLLEKAAIYDKALDALLCVQNEAVGLPGLNDIEPEARAIQAAGSGVTVTPEVQYFELVTAAVFTIERISAQRLRNISVNFDPKGLAAELEKLLQEEANARNNRQSFSLDARGQPKTLSRSERVELGLDDLAPKLQKCVWRAKAT